MDQATVLKALRDLYDAVEEGCFDLRAGPDEYKRGQLVFSEAGEVLRAADKSPD